MDSKDSQKLFLDHIVVLVPYQTLVDPPKWLADAFIISPGGRHGDDKTENRLILLADGCYLELIAFIDDDPQRREGHWWGMKRTWSIVDVAFSTSGDGSGHFFENMQRRLGDVAGTTPDLNAGYEEPRSGGRTRLDHTADGKDEVVEIKWKVTFPTGVVRGQLPFFCHDVTPRDRRVPVSKENTTHPCQAWGVESLTFTVDESALAGFAKLWSAALGVEARVEETDTPAAARAYTFRVGRLNEVHSGAAGPQIRLRAATSKEDKGHDRIKDEGVLITNLILSTHGEKPFELFKDTIAGQ